MIRNLGLFFLSSLVLNSPSQAASHWYTDIAFADGGDELAEVEVKYYYGDTDVVDITAGGGFSLSAGRNFELGAEDGLQVLTTLGYKSDGVFSRNGESAEFDRATIDILAVYQWQYVRLGAGVTYETNVELDLKDLEGNSDDFDDASGYIMQVDWRVNNVLNIGLRYTVIDYEASDFNGMVFDGDNISLRAGFSF